MSLVCDQCFQITCGQYCEDLICPIFYCFSCIQISKQCHECKSTFSVHTECIEKEPSIPEKKLVIFDIDGVMISSKSTPTNVIPRPDLQKALDFAKAQGYDVAIWTAATQWWADCVVNSLFTKQEQDMFVFIWSKKRCTQHKIYEGVFEPRKTITLKKLKKVRKSFPQYGRNIKIIDDTPDTYLQNYGDAIPITTYTGNGEKYTTSLVDKLKNYLK